MLKLIVHCFSVKPFIEPRILKQLKPQVVVPTPATMVIKGEDPKEDRGQGHGSYDNGGNNITNNCSHNQAKKTKGSWIESTPPPSQGNCNCIYRKLIDSIQSAHGCTSCILYQSEDRWSERNHSNYNRLD